MRGNMSEEIWKDVKGFEGFYQVSNYGKVYSFHRSGKLLSPKIDKDGYYEVALTKFGHRKYKRVHRLVAEAFIDNPNPDIFYMINHIDSNPQNNYFKNLEWCDNFRNQVHQYRNNKKHKVLSDLDPLLFGEMVSLYKCGMTCAEIVEYYGLSCRGSEIDRVLKGERFSQYTGITKDIRRKPKKATTYSDDFVVNILKLYFLDKITQTEICNKFNLTPSFVSRVVNGKIRNDLYSSFIDNKEDYGITNT